VRRVGARQSVDFTPGRPFARPRVRRTAAVKGWPRSRWLTALGVHDQRVAWLTPKTCPSWLTRETWAAVPETWRLLEVRYGISTSGFRTRQITLVTTRLDPAVYRVADLADLYRKCWDAEISYSQKNRTTHPEDEKTGSCWHQSLGGCQPAATHSRLTMTAMTWFSCKAITVARPQDVRPRMRVPSSLQ
jgi:hypothetical protein